MKMYVVTMKYIREAIKEFWPLIEELITKNTNDASILEELCALKETYGSIVSTINRYIGGNYEESAFDTFSLEISDEMLENLARLTIKLLDKKKKELEKVEAQVTAHRTVANVKKQLELQRSIEDMEGNINTPGGVLNRFIGKGPLIFPGEKSNGKKIFISYAIEDKVLAGGIKKELEKSGFNVFVAHDKDSINPSEEWFNKIIQEIEDCSHFLALRTKSFVGKPTPEQECGMALALRKKIYPIKVDTDEGSYGFIKFKQSFKFNKDDVIESCKELIKYLK